MSLRNSPNSLATLMFHGLQGGSTSLEQNVEDEFYTVRQDIFDSILSFISSNNYQTINTKNFDSLQLTKDPKHVCLTFDDGWQTDWSMAMPLLSLKNMTAIFFVVTDWIGSKNFMTVEQLREMHAAGMDIQVHGKTHQFLTTLSDQEVKSQLTQAKQYLEEILNKEVNALSFPGGRGDQRVMDIARDLGYKYFFSSRPGWYDARSEDVPRFVVHKLTDIESSKNYLTLKKSSIIWSVLKYRLKRLLSRLIGVNSYNRIKSKSYQ